MRDPLRDADLAVQALRKLLRSGMTGLNELPASLRHVLQTGAWQRRIELQSGQEVGFESFEQFVHAQPLEGIGSDMKTIWRLAGDDNELRDMLTQATKGKKGAHHLYNVQVLAPTGNRADAALRRLRKDRPDLHAQVLAGELSPHAAAIEAGFRKRTITIPIDPAAAAAALQRHFTPEQLDALLAVLCPACRVEATTHG